MTNQVIVDFERHKYEEACLEMRQLLREEKEMAARKKSLRQQIIEMSGGDRMEYGLKVTHRVSQGTIDYAKFITDCKVKPSTLEFYRKSDKEYWEIRSY